MTRMLMVCADKTDACSFYRGVGPFTYIDDLQIDFPPGELTWATCIPYDIAFFQRPFSLEHCQLIRMLKQLHIPVWIDYDDDLLQLPECNPSYDFYEQAEIQNQIKYCLQEADLVTVSTPFIQKALSPHTNRCVVVENAWNFDLYPPIIRPLPEERRVMWRGGPSHAADLMHYKPAIVELMESYPASEWVFVGNAPKRFTKNLPSNHQIIESRSLLDYFDLLLDIRPRITVVPLVDNSLNHGKSNIAWMEGAYTGSVCVAPAEIESFNQPGVVHYAIENLESFKEAFIKAYHMPRSMVPLYSLTQANELRANLLKSLIKP